MVLVVSVAIKQYRTLRNGQGLTASLVSVHRHVTVTTVTDRFFAPSVSSSQHVHRQVTITTVTDRFFAPSVSSSQHVQRPRLLLPLYL